VAIAFGTSLRFRLIAACAAVQFVALVTLLFYGARELRQALEVQAARQSGQVVALLQDALAAPLAERDYATVQQLLDDVRRGGDVDYLVLRNPAGRAIAASGWPLDRPLPPRDVAGIDLHRTDATLHLAGRIDVAGQSLGTIDMGISTAPLREARAAFVRHAIGVGALALVLSSVLLGGIAIAVTRRLAHLAQASEHVAAGDFDVVLPTVPADELGRLGATFNTMAAQVKERVRALEAAEAGQREHLQVVRNERSRLTTLLAAMQSGILFVDARGTVMYGNAAFARIWSLPDDFAGRPVADLVPRIAARARPDARPALALLAGDDPAGEGELEIPLLDERIVVQRRQPVQDGGCIWLHEDITLERRMQHRARQATLDPLTGRVNRRGLYESLHAAIAHAGRAGTEVALMFIDLDDFKFANDVGGHRAGDELLVAVADALMAQLRRGEVVARLGGDEFAVICPGLGTAAAGPVAERLVRAVTDVRIQAGDHVLRVGASVGVAHFPKDASNADDLIACADTAMYQAKHRGKGQWASYVPDDARLRADAARVDWNERIRRALADDRFVLHWQPVVHAGDARIAHHEALLRMRDETDPARLHMPPAFIAHAERSGRIREVDRWVFRRCVERLAAWPEEVTVAANLSARSLEDPDFVPFLAECLEAANVDPRRLHIELTETSAFADPLAARQRIARLRGLGCRVHLDDFGAGFNTFAQLKLLDVDAIKIDGTFVRDLANDEASRIFVGAMVRIARTLGKQTVAEHVEDAATLEMLRAMGCDFVQGYHVGRPGAELASREPRARLRLVGAGGASEPQ
jgi:diguanylate cyclase (GGDEF)-like protein